MDFDLISADVLYARIKNKDVLALIDVREHGVHSQGHPLFAVPLPLSKFELEYERLIPCKSVSVILLDQGNGEGLAERAAEFLKSTGYSDVQILEKGIEGWHGAGYELFTGVNVPSKAFGEFVEHECGTPHITAGELNKRRNEGEKISVFDSRPYAEYHRMCIPGGLDMPGAELVHRFYQNTPDDEHQVVVNCAGRTRSIIGAQSLINAGIKNPVAALKDGTMGWYLEGLDVENGAERVAEMPEEEAFEVSLSGAQHLANQLGVTELAHAELRNLEDNQATDPVFFLDVRTLEEFEAGHMEGSYHAPGGQLVQATDEYVGIRGAKLVLLDDRKVRALMTASWLKQLGWREVYVYSDFGRLTLRQGAQDHVAVSEVETLSPMELDAVVSAGDATAVIDFSTSLSYRAGHVPGAYWMIRSRIDFDIRSLPAVGFVVLTADDERLAHLAASEVLKARPELIVRVLKGGNKAWKEAGLRLDKDQSRYLSAQDDVWYKPYDNKDKIRERMQEYLDWEVALIAQIERDATADFNIYKP